MHRYVYFLISIYTVLSKLPEHPEKNRGFFSNYLHIKQTKNCVDLWNFTIAFVFCLLYNYAIV